jgi:hypothetical protein
MSDRILDLSQRYDVIVDEIVGAFHTLPLSPATAAHYHRVAVESATNAPSERIAEAVVRAAVSLELSEIIRIDMLASRILSSVSTE